MAQSAPPAAIQFTVVRSELSAGDVVAYQPETDSFVSGPIGIASIPPLPYLADTAVIEDLANVQGMASLGQVLTWTGSVYEPQPPVTGGGATNLGGLTDVITSGVFDAAYLKFDQPSGMWHPEVIQSQDLPPTVTQGGNNFTGTGSIVRQNLALLNANVITSGTLDIARLPLATLDSRYIQSVTEEDLPYPIIGEGANFIRVDAFLGEGDVVLASGETGSGDVVRAESPTLLIPVIASFASANHNHTSAASGGLLPASSISSGVFDVARIPALPYVDFPLDPADLPTTPGTYNTAITTSITFGGNDFTGTGALVRANNPGLDASVITRGTLPFATMPVTDLDNRYQNTPIVEGDLPATVTLLGNTTAGIGSILLGAFVGTGNVVRSVSPAVSASGFFGSGVLNAAQIPDLSATYQPVGDYVESPIQTGDLPASVTLLGNTTIDGSLLGSNQLIRAIGFSGATGIIMATDAPLNANNILTGTVNLNRLPLVDLDARYINEGDGGGGGATSLTELLDVQVQGVADKHMLIYDAADSRFENRILNLASDTGGVLPMTRGGTGLNLWPQNALITGGPNVASTNAVPVNNNSPGDFLRSNGTGAPPTFQTLLAAHIPDLSSVYHAVGSVASIDLSDVTGKTGSNSTIVFSSDPNLTAPVVSNLLRLSNPAYLQFDQLGTNGSEGRLSAAALVGGAVTRQWTLPNESGTVAVGTGTGGVNGTGNVIREIDPVFPVNSDPTVLGRLTVGDGNAALQISKDEILFGWDGNARGFGFIETTLGFHRMRFIAPSGNLSGAFDQSYDLKVPRGGVQSQPAGGTGKFVLTWDRTTGEADWESWPPA